MIQKWHLSHPDCHLSLPRGTKVLSAKVVDDKIYVWTSDGISTSDDDYHFLCRNTGTEAPLGYEFIDTCICKGIVWHVFVDIFVDGVYLFDMSKMEVMV